MKYKDPITDELKDVYIKVADTYPVGGVTEIPDDMAVPDGWEEVTNDTNYKSLQDNLLYRNIDNIVEIISNYNPNVTLTNGGWQVIGTLPENYRPSADFLAFPVLLKNSNDSTYLIGMGQILSDGTIRINQRTGSSVAINNVVFTMLFSTL